MAKIKLDENLVAQNVKELIENLGVSATAEISKVDDNYFVDIKSEDSSLLIGKYGINLESLQFVLAVRLKTQTGLEDFDVYLDIDNWRKSKEQKIEKMALATAAKVEETQQEEPLYNLKPSERRVIHALLTDHPKVTTESTGEGESRYLIIKPR
ncbi:MAG: R3H domain-containing nucleic acid-binding protein [Candidatus Magasanikbacteria bacterium]|nr:R3H domain-containing nucleic acid-binding protein [Candidatus Magasanikbacteria bacterium]